LLTAGIIAGWSFPPTNLVEYCCGVQIAHDFSNHHVDHEQSRIVWTPEIFTWKAASTITKFAYADLVMATRSQMVGIFRIPGRSWSTGISDVGRLVPIAQPELLPGCVANRIHGPDSYVARPTGGWRDSRTRSPKPSDSLFGTDCSDTEDYRKRGKNREFTARRGHTPEFRGGETEEERPKRCREERDFSIA